MLKKVNMNTNDIVFDPEMILKAIKLFCYECVCGDSNAYMMCSEISCNLHPFRLVNSLRSSTNALRCIKKTCIECYGNKDEVKNCNSNACTLYPYRN